MAKGLTPLLIPSFVSLLLQADAQGFIRTVAMPTRRHGSELHHSPAPSGECYQCLGWLITGCH
jgi:hypothetical protein